MGKPEIRFKGYTDEWEQRKLIEVCDYVDYRGKTPTKTENGIFLVTAKNVKDGFIDYETSKEYISENAYEEVMRRGKPEIGDVLITTEAPCGNVAQVNKADIALAQRIIKYRGHIGVVDNTYLKYYLLSPEFQKILNAKSSGGTVQGIKGSILHQQKIIYPSYEEQKKIGQHMDSLDHLITLHQRKCEQTKKLKKYMLQKMFPQNGAKVPEIRFDGFTYDWEQRKLSELLEKYEDPVETPHDGYERVGIRSHAKGTFHSFVEPGKELDTAKMYRVAADKFILNITFAWEHAVAITDNNDAGKLVSHRFPQFSFNPKLKPHFFKYLMLDKKFREHLELSSPGGAGRNRVLKISDMLKYEIKLPSIEEQIKIGEYFDSLDHLITLHQRKCDELKKMKKYMLQNMFI